MAGRWRDAVPHTSRSRTWPLALASTGLAALAGCAEAASREESPPPRAEARAGSAFWEHWGDGRAELSSYAVRTERYGEPRDGEVVLIYVTEPMDSRVWIKDDRGDVPDAFRVNVLKLNRTLKFRTGLYPYSVMTSVFAPVDGLALERFAPVKITLSAQEWCGHVYHTLKPDGSGFADEIRSYFHDEGERASRLPAPPGTLYEDALWIQLRELDGPFHGGRDWQGSLVPTLWDSRKAHVSPRPEASTIRRSAATREGVPVTRFTVERGARTLTLDVEREPPRRILGWSASDGEEARLLGTARLPYWQLNRPGDESWLERIGLGPDR
jgi:hypothetical protein